VLYKPITDTDSNVHCEHWCVVKCLLAWLIQNIGLIWSYNQGSHEDFMSWHCHLTYCEMPTEYAQTLFWRTLTPGFNFWRIYCMFSHWHWLYIAILRCTIADTLSPYSHTFIIGIPSPTHSFTLGLNPSFSANPPYRSLSFLSFKIHYTVSQKKTRHQTLAHNFPKC